MNGFCLYAGLSGILLCGPRSNLKTKMCRNYGIGNTKSNKDSLEAAVEAAATVLNAAVKPVLVAGSKMRVAKAAPAFQQLADACGYAVAIMPDAKGQISEEHPQFIGTYWGCVSSSCTSEIVESADCYLFAGPIFNDYRYCVAAFQLQFFYCPRSTPLIISKVSTTS